MLSIEACITTLATSGGAVALALYISTSALHLLNQDRCLGFSLVGGSQILCINDVYPVLHTCHTLQQKPFSEYS